MSVAHSWLSPQLGQRAINFVARDRAALDVDQTVGIAPEKTDHSVLRMHGDTIAISILFGGRDDRPHGQILELADALQNVADLAPFDRELVLAIDVLISAAATTPEVWTLRRDAMRRAFFNIDKFCFGELFFLANDFGRDRLALDRVRNEDGFALLPSDAFPAESDVFDF